MKTILLKLTKGSPKLGPFDITDQFGNVIATNVSIYTLIEGINYEVEDNVDIVTLSSKGNCTISRSMPITTITVSEFNYTKFEEVKTACLWKHLQFNLFNSYYGVTEPYIIEYVFSYQFQDELLQNVKDYTKVFKYLSDPSGVFSYTDRIMVDDIYFNKAILYNGQQCSGVLELIPKPKNNLQSYNTYPIYRSDSKVIIYTKSDSFYNYNTFWDVLKNKTIPIAITSCESLSSDGIINNSNMEYGNKSFKKSPLKAKDLKIRHILDNRSDAHLVSQFIISPTMVSYK